MPHTESSARPVSNQQFSNNNTIRNEDVPVQNIPVFNQFEFETEDPINLQGLEHLRRSTVPVRNSIFDNPSKAEIKILKINPNGKLLGLIDTRGRLVIIDISSGEVKQVVNNLGTLKCLDWKDNRVLGVGAEDGYVHVLDVHINNDLDQDTQTNINKNIFRNSFNSSNYQNNPNKHKNVLVSVKAHSASVTGLSFSKQEGILASTSEDKTVSVIDFGKMTHGFFANRGSLFKRIQELDPQRITARHIGNLDSVTKVIQFHPFNWRWLFVGGGVDDRKMRVFDIITGQLIVRKDMGSQITGIVFGDEGKTILTSHGYGDHILKVWTLQANQNRLKVCSQRLRLKGHSQRILHVACSPCGRYVVSGSPDETLRIWDVFQVAKSETRNTQNKNSIFSSSAVSRIR